MVADGIDNIDEKLDYYIGENKHLEAELAKCKAERDEVRELVTMRLEDMNRNGKTILDFYAVWLRQSRDEITKLRARCERYEAALEKIGRLKADNKRLHEELAKSRAERNEYFVSIEAKILKTKAVIINGFLSTNSANIEAIIAAIPI